MNITVKNSLGEQFGITVVRYFKFNGVNYLIFTKNEIDEAGYQKLYISKINNMVGNNIDDDIEWKLVSDTIKVIAKANKENTTLPVQDLNEAEINGIQVVGQKPFKITTSSVALLGANRNIQPTNVVTPNPNPTVTPMETVVPPVAPQASPVYSEPVQPVTPVQQPIVPPVENVVPTPQPVNVANPAPVEAVPFTQPTMPTEQPLYTGINPTTVTTPINSQPMPTSSPLEPQQSVSISDPFNFSTPTPVAPQAPAVDTVDYKKLYEEQTLKLNTMTTELEKYKALVEQLKTILK